MPIPDYQTVMLPLLRFLGDGQEHAAGAGIEAMASEFELTETERGHSVESGPIRLIATRVHWAMSYLAQAGLADRPRRGIWAITNEGKRVLDTNPERIDNSYLNRYEAFRDFLNRGEPAADGYEGDDYEAESADVPTIDELLGPILSVLADGTPRDHPDLVAAVADKLDLDDKQRNRRISSGRTVIANRVAWARTSLIKAGLVEQPGPSLTVTTPAGIQFASSHQGPIDGLVLQLECPGYANWISDMGGELPPSDPTSERGPTPWMVRAGEGGSYAPLFLEKAMVMLGWGSTGPVSEMSRDEIAAAVTKAFPDLPSRQRGQAGNALFRLSTGMRLDDVIVTPEPGTRTILLGKVAGTYGYLSTPFVSDYQHIRPVRWFARISRDELSYGARNSLGTLMTLTRPSHEAELLRLAELHRGDQAPAPLTRKLGSVKRDPIPERVAIPTNASMSIPPANVGDFQTVPRKMIQLLGELDSGHLALPDFQRTFVWAPDATRELLVSMIRSFPAGALLFLQGGSSTFKARAAEGAPELCTRPSYLILDGQQRLTSLYQAVFGVGDARFFLDIGALLTGADINDAVRVLTANRASEFATLNAQARSLMMPLASVRDGGAGRWRDDVVDARSDDDSPRVRRLLSNVERAYIDPLVQYAFPVTVLPEATPLEAVCTIFETLNRTGKPLTPFELISARAFAGGHSLYDYWSTALDRHPILHDFVVEPYYLLQCIALRLGLSGKRSSVLALNPDDIAREWDNAVADMAAVLTMLRDECGVLIARWLPYRPMLIPLAGAWRDVRSANGPKQGAMRAKLKRWFWCACFTGEYESSSASLAERDTPVIRGWLDGGDEPPVVRDFEWKPEDWRSVTSRQQGLYRSTMALTLMGRPSDFFTAAPLTSELIEARKIDDHHVFPRGYLKEVYPDIEVDSILNHCLIDRDTNIRIGSRPPSEYLAEIRAHLGPDLDRVLASHQLPQGTDAPLASNDFDGFLSWRIDRLSRMLVDLTGGLGRDRTQINPHRSDLDARIETIELAVREAVIDALKGDISLLPSHVDQKLADRIVTSARKNPSVTIQQFEDLRRRLEFCDLRDLEHIVTAKALWPRFEVLFRSKEAFVAKFDQLAELRNGFRHSRTVGEITRKEGEAAILWFEQLLGLSGARSL